ncbi:hypothetical protein HDU78_008083 [Chytriomyces hyalinus]|nr:hypothetical protein HDU78_008083 [Chytriomyces hyalinus]
MSTAACNARIPTLQATLQICGYVFDATGAAQVPATANQANVQTCMCSTSSLAIFQATLADCASNAAVSSNLNPVISLCSAAGAGTGTGVGTGAGTGVGTGTGTGVGTGTGTGLGSVASPCELNVQLGLQGLNGCGVTIDAAGNVKQSASDAQTATCLCTQKNLSVYKMVKTSCESEVSPSSAQALPLAKSLIAACESGTSLNGAGAGSGTGSSAGSAAVTPAAAPSKGSGAVRVGAMGMFLGTVLLI